MPDPLVRVRMAPSPTGPVHVGSARTALFNWLYARSTGGAFVLRIDDTDLARSTAESESGILDGFRWLGLDWDEMYRQSERLDIYREHAAELLGTGAAYRCFCTPEELARERTEAEAAKRPYTYSGRCRENPPPGRTDFVVRFHVGGGQIEIEDLIRGRVAWDGALLGDFIIVKRDGYATYNFASPVDDALLGITHVIRAEEHLSNTPYQIMVLQALGLPLPTAYAHVSWILGHDGRKLSKRRDPVLLTDYRAEGFLAQAMVNYLALLGWNPGTEEEIFSLAELVDRFAFDRVQSAGAIFDRAKLEWVNGTWIRERLSDAELAELLVPVLPEMNIESIRLAVPALRERLRTLNDARDLLAYLWTEPAPPALDEATRVRVMAAVEVLAGCAWEASAIETNLEGLREAHGWSRGQLFNPLRLALTGGNSPPIHHTLALLPRDSALARLRAAAEEASITST